MEFEWWDSLVTPASGSPLSSAAGGLWAFGSLRCRAQGGRLQLQPTGSTRQKRAEGIVGAVEGKKTTKGTAPSKKLSRFNSLILNLHPPSNSRHSKLTHAHSCSYHWLPSSQPPAMNGQTGTKPHSSRLRKFNHWFSEN